MKNLPLQKIPRRCRIFRASSFMGEIFPVLRALAPSDGHARGCPACRRVADQKSALDHALRREAGAVCPELPVGLETRLLASLSQPPASRAFSERAHRLPLGVVGWGFATAALAALALVALRFPRVQSLPLAKSAPTSVMPAIVGDKTREIFPGVARDLLRQDPLQQEANAVYADARAALQFLEINFTPIDLARGSDNPRLHADHSDENAEPRTSKT